MLGLLLAFMFGVLGGWSVANISYTLKNTAEKEEEIFKDLRKKEKNYE